MLAQNFKTPAELEISDIEFEALVKVLGMFDRGEIPPEMFRMNQIGSPDCGTAGCICGWAKTIDRSLFNGTWSVGLDGLFIRPSNLQNTDATPPQAAIALRNYLTSGEPRWAEAMATDEPSLTADPRGYAKLEAMGM